MSVKALKRALKKAGLKTSGRKSALTKRAKKAHLMRGGAMACYTDGTKNSKTKTDCIGEKDEWKDDGMMDVENDAPATSATPGENPSEGGRSRRRRNRSRRGIFGKLF
jgi:hypothetical protein